MIHPASTDYKRSLKLKQARQSKKPSLPTSMKIQPRDRLPYNRHKLHSRSQMEMLWLQMLTLKTKFLGILCFELCNIFSQKTRLMILKHPNMKLHSSKSPLCPK
jgi:hypothetical protein